MGTSGNILVSVEVLTEFKLVACLMVGLVEAVTLVLNLEAEVVEVIEISEKADPLPLSRDSLLTLLGSLALHCDLKSGKKVHDLSPKKMSFFCTILELCFSQKMNINSL